MYLNNDSQAFWKNWQRFVLICGKWPETLWANPLYIYKNFIHVRALHVQIVTCLVIVSEASSLHGHDLCLRLFIYLGCINLAWCICLACSELSPIPSINEFNDSLDNISVDTNVGRLYSLKPTFERINYFEICLLRGEV